MKCAKVEEIRTLPVRVFGESGKMSVRVIVAYDFDSGEYLAISLEINQIGSGSTPSEAVEELKELLQMRLDRYITDPLASEFRCANPGYFWIWNRLVLKDGKDGIYFEAVGGIQIFKYYGFREVAIVPIEIEDGNSIIHFGPMTSTVEFDAIRDSSLTAMLVIAQDFIRKVQLGSVTKEETDFMRSALKEEDYENMIRDVKSRVSREKTDISGYVSVSLGED